MHTFHSCCTFSEKTYNACTLRDMKEGCFLFVWCVCIEAPWDEVPGSGFANLQQQVCGRWREGVVCSSICGTKKKTSITSSHFFLFFFYSRLLSNMETVSRLWFHSSLPAQQVCSFYSPVPNLHSPLTCTVEQENAAACTLCNLRYQRRACLFVWQKRWANSAGYVLTVQCFLSALTAESKVAASPACVHESASLRSVTGDADGCN